MRCTNIPMDRQCVALFAGSEGIMCDHARKSLRQQAMKTT